MSFLRFSSLKGSWGGVDDAVLARMCRTAVAISWATCLIAADNAVRLMMADAVPGIYNFLSARRMRVDVSDIY